MKALVIGLFLIGSASAAIKTVNEADTVTVDLGSVPPASYCNAKVEEFVEKLEKAGKVVISKKCEVKYRNDYIDYIGTVKYLKY